MKLPFCFYDNHNFTIWIDSLNKHHIAGRFCINQAEIEFSQQFNGLIYQLTNSIYNFTFSINWEYSDVPSYTTFSGMLSLSGEEGQNLLDLNWLLVNEENNNTSQGSSHLIQQVEKNNSSKNLPFPEIKLSSSVFC